MGQDYYFPVTLLSNPSFINDPPRKLEYQEKGENKR